MLPAWKRIQTRQNRPFTIPIVRPKAPPPEANPWWWNPRRAGVLFADDGFMRSLREIDADLRVVWNGYTERWQVWAPKPKLMSKYCQGWNLLFPVQHQDGSYCPLGGQVLAKLYDVSARKYGNSRQYFDRLCAEEDRDRQKMEDERNASVQEVAWDRFHHVTTPHVGFGQSYGSKSVDSQ